MSEVKQLKHIAFIMDGNGRWAKKRGLPRTAGHKKGGDAFRTAARHCLDLKIPVVTFFAFSTENKNRPKEEVDTLIALFDEYLIEAEKYAEDKTRLVFLGDKSFFPDAMVAQMNKLERVSRDYDRMTLCLALNYGGRADIVTASRKLAALSRDRDIRPDDIDEKLFSSMLSTTTLPEVDLMIRTGGHRRISNFLLWQSAYAEMYFTDTLWPDFGKKELDRAIAEFNSCTRNFGLV
jgi:undecaprenyl diphosphate synthase